MYSLRYSSIIPILFCFTHLAAPLTRQRFNRICMSSVFWVRFVVVHPAHASNADSVGDAVGRYVCKCGREGGASHVPQGSHRICMSSVFGVLLGVAGLEQRRHANSVGTMVCERGERGEAKTIIKRWKIIVHIHSLLGTLESYPFCIFFARLATPPSLASIPTEFAPQACLGWLGVLWGWNSVVDMQIRSGPWRV